jgi:ubiquinone/menaquinone biosynthesis C-methylase UbiE
MDKEYELKYHLSEEKNWWFVARRNAIINMLKHKNKSIKILDIGCAGGPLIKDLAHAGFTNVSGIDFSPEAIELCKKRNLENVFVMDAHATSFEDNSFDLIIASDCLEHLEDDQRALKDWHRILKKEGEAIIFVPAFNFLWSSHDVVNQHFRRYTKKSLNEKLIQASFTVEKNSYWNFTLFFPTALIRILQNKIKAKNKESGEGQIVALNPFLNSFLINLLKIENLFFTKTGLPLGVSVSSTAKK